MIWSVSTSARSRPDRADDLRDGLHGVQAPTGGCRRNGLRRPRRPPSGARPGACGRRAPAGPRSCGSRSRRSARRAQDVRVHAQAHRAPGAAPLEARASEDLVSPRPRPAAYLRRPGTTMRVRRTRPCGPRHVGGGAQVPDPRVRARADEHAVERISVIGVPGSRSMYSSARSSPSASGSGTASVTGDDHRRASCPRSPAARRGGVDGDLAGRSRAVIGVERPPARDRRVEVVRGGRAALTQAKVVSSGAIMPARPPPRWSCCRRSSGPPSRGPRSTGPGTRHVADSPATPSGRCAEHHVLGGDAEASSPSYGAHRWAWLGQHWVASTCSTSLVPIPKASAPNAPWVAVWSRRRRSSCRAGSARARGR